MVAMVNLCDQGTETGILLTDTVTCLMYRSTLYLNKTKLKKKPKKHKNQNKQKLPPTIKSKP